MAAQGVAAQGEAAHGVAVSCGTIKKGRGGISAGRGCCGQPRVPVPCDLAASRRRHGRRGDAGARRTEDRRDLRPQGWLVMLMLVQTQMGQPQPQRLALLPAASTALPQVS